MRLGWVRPIGDQMRVEKYPREMFNLLQDVEMASQNPTKENEGWMKCQESRYAFQVMDVSILQEFNQRKTVSSRERLPNYVWEKPKRLKKLSCVLPMTNSSNWVTPILSALMVMTLPRMTDVKMRYHKCSYPLS